MNGICKISVCIPPEYSETLMDAVTGAIDAVYPGYERAFTVSRVTGTWRPMKGSSPFKGTAGKIETADEAKIEFVIRKSDLKDAVKAIRNIHPYEEPCIDIIEMTDWHSVM